jgi:ABC-2 type transport system permease protein
MKQLMAFIIKEFRHIYRDVRTMVILFGIPIAQLLIFGTVIKNEISGIRIAIYDPSNDATTRAITSKILASGYFTLEEHLDGTQNIETIFRKGKTREVIVFEDNFEEKLIREGKASMELIADASDPVTARLATNYTRGIVMDYLNEEYNRQNLPALVNIQYRMFYNEGMKSSYLFVPGVMALILMLVSALMTSVSITREKEMGTMEVLLVSPLRPIQIIAGKVFPYVILSIINALVIILLGHFVFAVPIKGSFILLLGESILYIIMALCMGIFISTISKNQIMAMFISLIGLMLPTVLLSGFIFPIENMPRILQVISNVMPARWFIEIVRGIMLKGAGLGTLWMHTAILAGMTVFFILLSTRKFKIRLE